MKSYRRQRHQYLFAGLLGVIAVVNLLFFFILYRPIRLEYFSLQETIQKSRADIRLRHAKIDRLEKLSAQLERSAQDRLRLYTMHFIPKSTGWSEIVPEINMMTQAAGVKNTRKEYQADEKPQYGLYSVKIRVPVAGTYSNVVNMIKEIESSDTFFIINSIDLRSTAAAEARGGPATSFNTAPTSNAAIGDVTMNLNIETFFYQ